MADMQHPMAARLARRAQPALRQPLARLGLAALGIGAAVPLLVLVLAGPNPAAMAAAVGGYGAGMALSMALMRRGYPHTDLGLCNLVTLARLALAAALLAPLAHPGAGWPVFAVALVALSLDGVDGWLARREGRVSDFGARFDMEVDAALALILALNAWAAGTVGAAVLLLGMVRYAFVAAAWALPWMAAPLPARFGRKVVCVMQIAALIALQAPIVTAPLSTALALGAGGAVAWSFGRDVVWLWRARR
jgi:phosphatidylglycerophosphate synthase